MCGRIKKLEERLERLEAESRMYVDHEFSDHPVFRWESSTVPTRKVVRMILDHFGMTINRTEKEERTFLEPERKKKR